MPDLNFATLQNFLVVLVVIIVAIDVHEFSHAVAATALGDDLPGYQGRLTLNPLAHLDPLGTLLIIMSAWSGFGFGWGKPVQVNTSRLRHGPAVGMGIVAFAGRASNMLLAIVGTLAWRLFGFEALGLSYSRLVIAFVAINLSLAFFNLIPLFPLDGFRIALAILRTVRGRGAFEWAQRLEATAAYGPMLFFLALMADQSLHLGILDTLIGIPVNFLFDLLMGSA